MAHTNQRQLSKTSGASSKPENQRKENSPTMSTSNQCQGSSLNSGITYLKYAIEEMQKHIHLLEEKLETNEQIVKKQVQNIFDMECQKQNMISEFKEMCRKHEQNSKFEKEFEEKIEDVGHFLEKVILLASDVEKIKINEKNVRNNILSKFRDVCSELEAVDNCCNINKNKYGEEIDKMKANINMQRSVEEEILKCDQFCRQKIAQLSNLVKSLNQDCENIKQEPCSMKEKSEKEINEMREQLKNTFMQTKEKIKIIRSYLEILKIESKNESCQVQLTINKLNKRLNKIEAFDIEITSSTKNKQLNLDVPIGKEINAVMIEETQSKIHMLYKECEDMKNILKEKRNVIDENQIAQQEGVKLKLSFEERINIREKEIDSLNTQLRRIELEYLEVKKNLNIFKTRFSSFTNEFSLVSEKQNDLEAQKNDLIQKKINVEKDNIELKLKWEIICKELVESKEKLDILKQSLFQNCAEENDKMFQMYSCIQSEQNFLANESMESELCELYNSNYELLKDQANLDTLIAKEIDEYHSLQAVTKEEEISLRAISEELEKQNNLIKRVKEYVKEGKYLTEYNLKKKFDFFTNMVKMEQEVIEKLKTDISALKEKQVLTKKTSKVEKRKTNINLKHSEAKSEENKKQKLDVFEFTVD